MRHIAAQYFLNTDLREEELREQAKLLCEAGYEEIFLHARAGLKTPYLSRAWFDAVGTVVGELQKYGVKFSIWDEDNFPSGLAGGRITGAFPELRASRLEFKVFEGKPGEEILEFFPEKSFLLKCFVVEESGEIADISEHCGTLRSEWGATRTTVSSYSPYGQLPLPHRRRSMNRTAPALRFTPERPCRVVAVVIVHGFESLHDTDLLNAETTKRFIEFTFDPYKKALGPALLREAGSASFFDEPAPDGDFPWTRGFPEEFEKRRGYDLLPLLPHLALDISDESAKIRCDYRTTLHELLCENYLSRLKTYLNAEGLLSAGHLTRSEWLSFANTRWPDELRCLKYTDIPCGDPLGGAVGRAGSTAHHLGLKAVASAARLFGCKAAGADAFAVGGDGVSLRDLKFLADYHLAMGITWFNIHGLDYTIEGERFDEAPPTLFYQHGQWPHMPAFLAYLKERCEALTGEHVCLLEMLYPDTMLKSLKPGDSLPDEALHNTAESLLSHQLDFELIDETTLAEQSPEKFAALRPFFLAAHTTRIVGSTAEFLERYAQAGGTVILTGAVPRIIDRPGAPEWAFGKERLADDFIPLLPPSPLAGPGKEAVLLRQVRKEDGSVITFLFNRADTVFDGTFAGKPLHLEPREAKLDSEIEEPPSPAPMTLRPEKWVLTFDRPNSVPLTFWEYHGGTVELFSRHRQEGLPFAEAEKFSARFLAAPGLRLFLTVEEDMLKKGRFSVNGNVLSDFVKADFRDCRERECEITAFLKPGFGPALNVVSFEGRPFFENPPYLRGRFSAQVFPGGENYPQLSPAPASFEFTEKADFREFGYGTCSGPARCKATFTVKAAGRYVFAPRELRDSGRLFVDGEEKEVRIAPPYRWEFGLEAGEHTLELEKCTNSGNRDRMLGLPAGIKF